MAGCDRCGDSSSLNYSCNYCSGSYCTSHRLPENHHCPGLRSANTHGPDFREGSDESGLLPGLFRRGGSRHSSATPGYDASKEPSTSEPDWESSPDVAPDGSIVDDSDGKVAESIDDADEMGLGWTMIGLLLLPFIFLYNAIRYLLSLVRSILTWPIPLVLFVGGIAIAAHLAGIIDLPIDAAASGIGGALSAAGNTSNTTTTPQEASSQSGSVNRTKIEFYVHEEINKERASRGLSELKWDNDLRKIARYHSEQMATRGFFAHTSPNGQTMGDRYDRFGYNCRVSTSGNRYLTGAENIAKTHHHKNVIGQGRLTTSREVAEALAQQWMESKGHRDNILTSDWNNEGIGVYITSENKVYATQNFC